MQTMKPVRRKNTIAVSGYDAAKLPEESEDFNIAFGTFLRNCKIRNLSDSTITYYRDVLSMLKRLLDRLEIKRPIDVTHEHINECVLAKRSEGVVDVTVDKYLRGWRAFWNFMHTEGYVTTNPFDKVARVKSESRIIETFTKPQIKALLNAPNKQTFTGYRDYVIMLTLLETGVRVSEALGILVTNINWKERLIKVYGKGRKERFVPFQKTLERHLKEYVKIRGLLNHDYLFVNIDNTPMHRRSLQENISNYGKAAGIKLAEAAKAMLWFGFRRLGLHRIYATCRPENIGSAKVMQKIGMKYEGHLRGHMRHKGQWHDSFQYSILEDEYEEDSTAEARLL
jgi:integrase/recombinase XerD